MIIKRCLPDNQTPLNRFTPTSEDIYCYKVGVNLLCYPRETYNFSPVLYYHQSSILRSCRSVQFLKLETRTPNSFSPTVTTHSRQDSASSHSPHTSNEAKKGKKPQKAFYPHQGQEFLRWIGYIWITRPGFSPSTEENYCQWKIFTFEALGASSISRGEWRRKMEKISSPFSFFPKKIYSFSFITRRQKIF